MPMDTLLLRFLLLIFAGWLQRRQALALAYVLEENRVLREQLEGKRLRFTDAQRRRLARKAKQLGRTQLRELATLARPDTSSSDLGVVRGSLPPRTKSPGPREPADRANGGRERRRSDTKTHATWRDLVVLQPGGCLTGYDEFWDSTG